jgi:signal transduction histidine kinase
LDNRNPSPRLSIPTKIFLSFSFVLILFSSVLVYNFVRLGRLYEEVTVINRGLVPLRLTLSEIEGDLRSFSVLLSEPDAVVLRSAMTASQALFPFPRRVEERLLTCMAAIEELVAQELAPRQEEVLERLQMIVEVLLERNAQLREQSARLERALQDEEMEGVESIRGEIATNLRQMQSRIGTLSRLAGRVVADALDWASSQQRRNVLTVAVTTAGAMVVALFVMLWVSRTLRPLTRLTEGVKKLRAGSFETVDVRARNEIGVLADEFNEMVRALQERDRRLEHAYSTAVEAERLAAIGRLTIQITHEIRNPLSSIGLNIELLEEEIQADEGNNEEALNAIRAITRQIDQLTGITEEYLRMVRVPTPKTQPEDLNELVRRLVDFHDGELSRAGLEIDLDLDTDLPSVQIDEAQLSQTILNLIRNAKEAMPEGGVIKLLTRFDDNHVELVIEDEGSGIEPEARDRIFDPFFTTKAQGTGLGLPFSRQIVDQHGGSLECSSAGERGTRFTVRLPNPNNVSSEEA